MAIRRPQRKGRLLLPGWTWCLVWMALLPGAGGLFAADEEIRVDSVATAVMEGRLTVSAQCGNLFTRKRLSTLQSGLPAVIQFEVQLLKASRTRSLFADRDGDYERVHELRVIRSITYNIWDERYTVRREEKVWNFSEFSQAGPAVSRLQKEAVVELGELEPEVGYAVRVRAQIIPISTEQGDRVTDWLRNPHRLETGGESEPGEEGFQLGLNQLAAIFWSKGEKRRDRSSWQLSRPFTIDESGGLKE